MTSNADTPDQSKLPLLHPDRLPPTLKTKINRKAPWVSLLPPTETEKTSASEENTRVALVQLSRLPDLARHLGIDPAQDGSSGWVFGLAIRLAQELQIPGFQERWEGLETDKMRLMSAGRRLHGSELGTAIVGHYAGSDKYKFTVNDKPPPDNQIPADPITSHMLAEILRDDGRASTDLEAAAILVDIFMPEYGTNRKATNAKGTKRNAITKISKLISQGRQSSNKA